MPHPQPKENALENASMSGHREHYPFGQPELDMLQYMDDICREEEERKRSERVTTPKATSDSLKL